MKREKIVDIGSARDAREPEPPVSHSDIALSNRFVDEYGEDLRHIAKGDRWLMYKPEEGRWTEDEKLEVWTRSRRLCTVQAKLVHASISNTNAARTAAKAVASGKTVAAVISLSRAHPRAAAVESQFDVDPMMLNTPGARAVDLRTGELREARREDYFTKTTAVAPVEMPTPDFDGFLLEIMGRHIEPEDCSCAACRKSSKLAPAERKAAHLAEVVALAAYQLRVYGYGLTGDVREQKLFVQIGAGGNGKGVLNDFISQDVFGSYPSGYSCEVPIEALLESKGERHPTDLMDLWHTRLALARESDADTRWNEGRVKRLTGSDRIKARRMRQDYVEFDPTHKLVVFGNEKINLKGADQAAWKRRVEMTVFPQRWADEADEARHIRKADKRLREKLRAEAPGVLHKLIQACLEWQKVGLNPPATVRETSDSYLAEQSTIAVWIDERVDTSELNNPATARVITVNELWSDYVRWCTSRREDPCARNAFNEKLGNAGIKITRTNETRGICRGVTLQVHQQDEGDSI